jgi:DNA polymerase-3 subunit alpha
LIQFAKEFGLKLVATNDVHYIEKGDSHAHDCLVCIGTQDLLSNPKRMSAGYVPEQFFLRSAEEMKARFAEVPEAVKNTLEVAEKCNLEIKFGQVALPGFSSAGTFHARRLFAPAGWRKGCSAATRFMRGRRARNSSSPALMIRNGCRRMMAAREPKIQTLNPAVAAAVKVVIDRLQLELGHRKNRVHLLLSHRRRFHPYGRSQGISCVARGSAAGSLVTYLLEIANVDPIRYGLLFERFLNPERVNPPDIDIDFADDRRADVIEYVRKKYGPRFRGADHHLRHDGREDPWCATWAA